MEVMEMFENDTQLMQAECAYDVAMHRMKKKYPNIKYSENLWNTIARIVIVDGYKAAMNFATFYCDRCKCEILPDKS